MDLLVVKIELSRGEFNGDYRDAFRSINRLFIDRLRSFSSQTTTLFWCARINIFGARIEIMGARIKIFDARIEIMGARTKKSDPSVI